MGFGGGERGESEVERKEKKQQDWGRASGSKANERRRLRKKKKKKAKFAKKNLIRMAPLSLFFDHLLPRPGHRAVTQRQLAAGKGPGSEPAAREERREGRGPHAALSFFFLPSSSSGAAGEERERREIVLPCAVPCALVVTFRPLFLIPERRVDSRDIRSGDRRFGNARDAVSERRQKSHKVERRSKKKTTQIPPLAFSLSLSLSSKNAPKW